MEAFEGKGYSVRLMKVCKSVYDRTVVRMAKEKLL